MLMATLHPTQVQSESLGGTQALVLKNTHTQKKKNPKKLGAKTQL